MAIYHMSTSKVKRSAGKSAVAAAAYRSGDKLHDDRTNTTHDYSRKKGIGHSEIMSPVQGQNWTTDRAQLWNKVEAAEKRKDSQLAREITVAVPKELDRDAQIDLVREFVRENYVDKGMIADINLHDLNSHNPHAHIMVTMRDLKVTSEGIEFGNKNREWNNWGNNNLLIEQRESWAKTCNKFLEKAGIEQTIDHRSNEEREIETIPQIHVGVHAMAMARRGIASDRMEIHDKIADANDKYIQTLERIYRAGERAQDQEKIRALRGGESASNDECYIQDLSPKVEEKVKKWQPTYQQETSGSLIDAVAELSNWVEPVEDDKYDLRLGNYRGVMSAPGGEIDKIQVYYRDELAMMIESEGNLYLSNLVQPKHSINQYERNFENEIKGEISRLQQQKEESDRQLEVEKLAQIGRDKLAYEQSLVSVEFEQDVNVDFSDLSPDQSRSPNRRIDSSPNR
jgi:MobA/MobL family